MIHARKVSIWTGGYEIVENGRRIATWERSLWTTGGTVEVGGRRYTVRANLLGGTSTMVEIGGARVGTAHTVGHKDWTIEADGATYHFRRALAWRHEEQLHDRGRRLGAVRRTSIWRDDASANLPGLPRTVEVFALVLVLTTWEWDAAATG